MSHLAPDELIDAVEGMLAPDRQAHLASCEVCQRELAGLSSVAFAFISICTLWLTRL